MQVVIFGADKLGIDFYFEIKANEEVVAFIDNNVEKQGTAILGINVYSADILPELVFDKIYIASLFHYTSIKCQIVKMGIFQGKISYLPIENYNNKKRFADNLMGFKNRKLVDSLYCFKELFREDKYEKAWMEIKEKYKNIFIYELSVEAIGEFIQRSFMAVNTCETDENKILRVFIPQTDTGTAVRRICNKFLVKLIGRKIYIVQEKESSFWAYILRTYPEDIDTSEYDKFSSRKNFPTYKISTDNAINNFTGEEIQEGNIMLERIGLNKPYVCFAARTATYNNKTVGHDFNYSARNMNFEDYEMAIKFLQKQNIITVKMGRYENQMKPMENCIDYAGLYADDFNDLYIASKCEFFVSSPSGIMFMATLFAKPILVVNSMPYFGYGGTPYTANDLYIPRKYYDVNRKRYLSLREAVKLDLQCLVWTDRYEKMGIQLIDNTPEEIVAAIQEMIERLSGRWHDTVEDKKNYERYMEIYHQMEIETVDNPDNWMGGLIPCRIASSYLRNNLYLLA